MTSPTTARTTAEDDATFTADERAAMKERAREVRAARRADKVDPEETVLAKIAEMGEADRVMAERIHAIVREVAPGLVPRLWYGMPAYTKDGSVVVFFKAAEKFKGRYATLGFEEKAALDDGALWPTSYALTRLGAGEEALIRELVARAAS
ncbi:iron chaperone [Actinotalea solisilvae]|uniref:iron chaperone n=1 Tax=Actinotalea solisilvae TaxID=2072922 RepID=UPI0018F22145|nr:DUF1801 domain-containing protein [Actinotalea solisilvae]